MQLIKTVEIPGVTDSPRFVQALERVQAGKISGHKTLVDFAGVAGVLERDGKGREIAVIQKNDLILRRVRLMLERCGYLGYLQNMDTMPDFVKKDGSKVTAKSISDYVFSHKKKLLLHGPPGTRKTTLSIYLALQAVKQGQSVYVTRADDLLQRIYRCFRYHEGGEDSVAGIIAEVCGYDFLVLDEIAHDKKEKVSASESDCFHSIFSHYESAGKMWVVTTNKNLDELKLIFGHAICSRLCNRRLVSIRDFSQDESFR